MQTGLSPKLSSSHLELSSAGAKEGSQASQLGEDEGTSHHTATTDTISRVTRSENASLAEAVNHFLYNVYPPKDFNGATVTVARFANSISALRGHLDGGLMNVLSQETTQNITSRQRNKHKEIVKDYAHLDRQADALNNEVVSVLDKKNAPEIKNLLKTMPARYEEQAEKIATSINQLIQLPTTTTVKMTATSLAQLSMLQMCRICFMYNHTEANQFHEIVMGSHSRYDQAKKSGNEKAIDISQRILTDVVFEKQAPSGMQDIWKTFKAYHEYNEVMGLPIVNKMKSDVKKTLEYKLDRKYVGEIENLHYQLSLQKLIGEFDPIRTVFKSIYNSDDDAKKYVEAAEASTLSLEKFTAPEFDKASDIIPEIQSFITSMSAAQHLYRDLTNLEQFSFKKRNALMLILWDQNTSNRPFRESMHSWADQMNDISSAYAQEQEFVKSHIDNNTLFDNEDRTDEDRAGIDELLQKLTHWQDIYSLIGKRLDNYADRFCKPMPASNEPLQWLSPHLKMLAQHAKARVVQPAKRSPIQLQKIYTADSLDPTQANSVTESTSQPLTEEAVRDLRQRTDSLICQADDTYGTNEQPGEWCYQSTPFFRKMAIKTMRDRYRSALHNLDKLAGNNLLEEKGNFDIEIQEKMSKCWDRQIVSQALLEDKRSAVPEKENVDELMNAGLASFGWSDKDPAIIQWEYIHPATGRATYHPLVEIQFNCKPIEVLLDSGESISYSIPPSYLHIHFKSGTEIQSLNEIGPEMSKLVTSSHMKLENFRDVGKDKAARLGFRYVPKVEVPADWAVEMACSVAQIPEAPM